MFIYAFVNSQLIGRGLVMGSIVVYLQSALVYGSLYDSLFSTGGLKPFLCL